MAQARAYLKLQRVTSRKAGLVADLIRHRPVAEALSILKYTDKKTAPILIKLLNSAIANAVNNHGMNAEKLFVTNILVTMGPTLKRFQPHGRGSASQILKRTSNLEIIVSEERA